MKIGEQMKTLKIEIKHDRDSFYGADKLRFQPEMEAKYERVINAEILKHYPQAEIKHEWGQFYYADVTVYVDEIESVEGEEIKSHIESIDVRIYGDGSFWNE